MRAERPTWEWKRTAVVAAGFLAAAFLSFNLLVWGTDLAITPLDAEPCLSLWGRFSCTSHPMVLVATAAAALVTTIVILTLVRSSREVLALWMIAAMVLASLFVVGVVKENCSGGLRLGREESAPSWACIGGIK